MLTKACKNTPGYHTCRRGIYLGVLGPNYETPAEVRFMRTIGADVVGMSTTLEVMAAKHGGLNAGGLTLCTNMASGVGNPLNHDEVVAVGRERAETFVHILTRFSETTIKIDLLPSSEMVRVLQTCFLFILRVDITLHSLQSVVWGRSFTLQIWSFVPRHFFIERKRFEF